MANRYTQKVSSSETRFSKAPQGDLEFSKMTATPRILTDFSAGDIVPILCEEVLPNSTFQIDAHSVIRQATILTPTMDNMDVDVYAFFVPNRVVNDSWKNVMGENSSGKWTAPQVSLAPLYTGNTAIQVPVCSVADYYGFPTQKPIPATVLNQCHDLKFRGYLDIYNNYFRDQNYQPPIPYSKLNVYNAFFDSVNAPYNLAGQTATGSYTFTAGYSKADGSFPDGAIIKAVYGEGTDESKYAAQTTTLPARFNIWNALMRPLKANKHHDYFTSVLPEPQKGPSVVISSLTPMPVLAGEETYQVSGERVSAVNAVTGGIVNGLSLGVDLENGSLSGNSGFGEGTYSVAFNNLYADPTNSTITLDDLRMSAAVQQVYEILGRSGSRYREYINSFFGLDIDNPFDDIPTLLGHYRRELDLYQTAQTSQSTETSAQGNLSAFGYTSKGGQLFAPYTFKEHGYVHVLAVVRHKNTYASYMARDNFRLTMLDFYQYPLANISEQPVYTREINPFANDPDAVFGYQEAWSEYRYCPSRVTGHMRSGVEDTLDIWSYVDNFDDNLLIADGDWLKSNSAEVLARGTAITDTYAPQFKAQFMFKIVKQLPMPTYSVAGLDII